MSPAPWRLAWAPLALLLGGAGGAAPSLTEQEPLALCGQCLNPVVQRKSGIGTSEAFAEAKVTRAAAQAWCQNWQPQANLSACVQEQLASEAQKTYRASANCQAGTITAADGSPYRLAGVWSSDVERGRTKWRDAQGNVVGPDEASGGLSIAQQWELLCPTGSRTSGLRPPAADSSGAMAGDPPSRGTTQSRASAAADWAGRPAADPAGMGSDQNLPPAAGSVGSMSGLLSPGMATGCGDQQGCAVVGPFAAQVTQLSGAKVATPRTHQLQLMVTFTNLTQQSIALAYRNTSSQAVDDVGHRYSWGRPGTRDGSAQGIGAVEGRTVGGALVLAPGESRTATFRLTRDLGPNDGVGSSYAWTAVIDELAAVRNGPPQIVREHNLTIRGLATQAPAVQDRQTQVINSAANLLKDILSPAK
jgi:hypothetical protein